MRRLTVLLLIVLAGVACAPAAADQALVEWTMIDVSPPGASGDAHLLRFADGTDVLIDTGFAPQTRERVLPALRRAGVGRLELLIITHAHTNHYGGVPAVLEAGIEVGAIVFNPPHPAACDAELPWGCNRSHIDMLLAAAAAHAVPVRGAAAGAVLYRSGDGAISLRVLYAFDGEHTPVGRTSINDTSLIMRLEAGRTSALLAGDLDHKIGRHLARAGEGLRADLLKVPHHGVESAAPDVFFDRVAPRTALVPGPADEWLGERGERMRRYFEKRSIPVYVNGVHGDVAVRIDGDGYRVATERAP